MSLIKKDYKRSILFGLAACIFVIIETIIFLFVYGWHIKPIGIEIYFDAVAMLLCSISAFYFLRVLNVIIKAIIQQVENNELLEEAGK